MAIELTLFLWHMPDDATEGVTEHSSMVQPSINLHAPVTAFMFLLLWYVLSEVVLELSGHDKWNCKTPYNIPFKECSKWYFIRGVRLLSIYCKEHSAAYCLWVKTCKRYFKSALSIQVEYSESIHDVCHVYLAALYHVSGTNQEKTTEHILEAKNGSTFRSFLKPQITNYSTLLFVDTVAQVCGFCFLF